MSTYFGLVLLLLIFAYQELEILLLYLPPMFDIGLFSIFNLLHIHILFGDKKIITIK